MKHFEGKNAQDPAILASTLIDDWRQNPQGDDSKLENMDLIVAFMHLKNVNVMFEDGATLYEEDKDAFKAKYDEYGKDTEKNRDIEQLLALLTKHTADVQKPRVSFQFEENGETKTYAVEVDVAKRGLRAQEVKTPEEYMNFYHEKKPGFFSYLLHFLMAPFGGNATVNRYNEAMKAKAETIGIGKSFTEARAAAEARDPQKENRVQFTYEMPKEELLPAQHESELKKVTASYELRFRKAKDWEKEIQGRVEEALEGKGNEVKEAEFKSFINGLMTKELDNYKYDSRHNVTDTTFFALEHLHQMDVHHLSMMYNDFVKFGKDFISGPSYGLVPPKNVSSPDRTRETEKEVSRDVGPKV